MQDDKRIRIITGHYGSGKTEFALNYAVALSRQSNHVALGDLDIVNVYFRSREKKEELEQKGIKVISSSLLQNSSDMPAVTGEIMLPVKDKSYDYVVDLGGNDVGTILVAQLKPYIKPEEVDFFMVINCNRPDTSTVEKIIEQKEKLESATGLMVTGFVNNTNLIRESTAENLLLGNKLILEASKLTGVPIKYTAYVEEVFEEEIPKESLAGELFPLCFFMRQCWM